MTWWWWVAGVAAYMVLGVPGVLFYAVGHLESIGRRPPLWYVAFWWLFWPVYAVGVTVHLVVRVVLTRGGK